MEKFLDYIGSDLPKGHQIKNLLFARTEYSSAFLLQGHEFIPRKDGLPHPNSQHVQIPQLISAANPMLEHKQYFLKLLKYEDKESGASVWENPCNHLNDLVSLDKEGLILKFSGFCAIEKRRLAQVDKISILTTTGSIGTSSGASTQATKATVLTINSAAIPAMSREDQNYYFFPENRSLPISSVEVTDYDLTADALVLGELSREILEQRIDETNERLLLLLNDRVLSHPSVSSGKLSYDLVYEGFRYLNALMALKAVYTEILSKLYLGPIKGLKLYQTLSLELEVVEAFCNSCTSPSLLPSLKLVVKNVRLLVTNPKQSFMLHLFALVTSQQSTEHMGNTQTVLAIRDFMQKDYLIQVFSSLKHSVFKKVSKNWDLSVDEVNMAIDVMIAWSAVKTSSMGRFWKARLFNNLIANCLMAFYLREINKQPREDPDQQGAGSKRAEVTLTTFVSDSLPKQGTNKLRAKPKDKSEELGEESRPPVQRGPPFESEHNPTPEATSAGRFLFKEAQRYLQHRKNVVAFYARL